MQKMKLMLSISNFMNLSYFLFSTSGVMGNAPAVVDDSLPATDTETVGARAGPSKSRGAAKAVAADDVDDDTDDMLARLEALRS